MTTPFIPLGNSMVISWADDSTDTAVTLSPGSNGNPNALYIVNADVGNVVAVSYSFDALDHNAVLPTSGADGLGVVITPFIATMLRIDSTYQGGNLYVSAAGTGTGNVYITPGAI